MKKKIIGLGIVAVLSISMSACTPKETAVEPALIEEPTLVQEINFQGKSLEDIKTFIDDNKENVAVEQFDEMIVLYDQQLRNQAKKLSEQYLKDPYGTALYNAINADGKLQVQNITDETIKKETLALLEVGYCFTMTEGEYYLTIDYKTLYNNYGFLMSECIKPYYNLMSKELSENYWYASFNEVKNRAELLELQLKDYPNSPLRENEKELLTSYILKLFQINALNGTIDYDTGLVSEEVKTLYRQIAESELLVTKQAILEMIDILEDNNFVVKMDDEDVNNKISALRIKYTNETGALVDQHYPIQ